MPRTDRSLRRRCSAFSRAACGPEAAARDPSKASAPAYSRRTKVAAVASALVVAAVIAVLLFLRDHGSNAASGSQPRLAVLPFENGGAPADAYFADGMTEAITNRLASISGISVIGRQERETIRWFQQDAATNRERARRQLSADRKRQVGQVAAGPKRSEHSTRSVESG